MGKPWTFANLSVWYAPLPLPLGEVSEHCEDGEGPKQAFQRAFYFSFGLKISAAR